MKGATKNAAQWAAYKPATNKEVKVILTVRKPAVKYLPVSGK